MSIPGGLAKMAKTDNPSPVEYPAPPPPYQDQQALVEALKNLTTAISTIRDVPKPSTEAKEAGVQYSKIKGALRRYFEPAP
jgi:hypothetical protein